ncbi:MAG: SGNH/GDSL hydrolase family protein [Novosphingobium sp.]|nr:SGNH/GDSL hydrolase family protein [Novosphingobium sp.]
MRWTGAAAIALAAITLAAGALAPGADALAQTLPFQPSPSGLGITAQPCRAQTGLSALSPQVLQNDWAWTCRYKQVNTMIAFRPRAVFIGDSITERWITLYPTMFAGGVIDRGISSQTSPQVLLRFYQDVVRLKPAIVHIMVGTNDLAGNTGPSTPEQYTDNIRAMVDIARANGIAVVIGSIPPAAAFPWKPALAPAAQIRELNRWLSDFAKAQGLIFADYYAVLADATGAMKPGLSSDGVHPNAAGYALMDPVAHAALAAAALQRH